MRRKCRKRKEDGWNENKEWKKANPEKVKEQKKRWRERNREKLREQKDRWRKANPERARERKQRYRKANPEKERERKERWWKANREKVKEQRKRCWEREKARLEVDEERLREGRRKARERKQRWRKADPEKARERKQRWRKANPEKVKEQRKRCREREKARLEVDEERLRETRRKARERQRRYRKANSEKVKEQRERNREAESERGRRYHQAHKEQRNEARRERYAWQKGRPVPPPLPCDCGLCLACGGWTATWQPAWHARLEAWSTPGPDSAKEDQPPGELEYLPLDLLESEAETLSIASTSEIESELGDLLETLLADESDSEVETGPATAPTRRSSRIAAMPSVSCLDWEEKNPMWEILERKAKLHSEAADQIVTRWELLDHRTERVDAIVEEMSVPVDPHHELDRFQAQLERQDVVMDVVVNEELFDFIGEQL